jgi:HSF-type DNA-binding
MFLSSLHSTAYTDHAHANVQALEQAHDKELMDAEAAAATSKGLIPTPKLLKNGRRDNFPAQLHHLLSEAPQRGLSEMASWQNHGRSFTIHRQAFVQHVLPLYFAQQGQFRSFQRQLNCYGFLRLVTKSGNGRDFSDKVSYYHELFLRDKPELSTLLVRSRISNQHHLRRRFDPSSEPNFDTMIRLSPSAPANRPAAIEAALVPPPEPPPPPLPTAAASPPPSTSCHTDPSNGTVSSHHAPRPSFPNVNIIPWSTPTPRESYVNMATTGGHGGRGSPHVGLSLYQHATRANNVSPCCQCCCHRLGGANDSHQMLGQPLVPPQAAHTGAPHQASVLYPPVTPAAHHGQDFTHSLIMSLTHLNNVHSPLVSSGERHTISPSTTMTASGGESQSDWVSAALFGTRTIAADHWRVDLPLTPNAPLTKADGSGWWEYHEYENVLDDASDSLSLYSCSSTT